MSSHILIRLRLLHPLFAVAAALGVLAIASRLGRGRGPGAARAVRIVAALVALQLGLGILNVALLAPVWLQLLHLLAADAVWIAFVLLGADTLAESAPSAAVRAA
jgi:cytochrome c oxidase assembly protein subunit 15